MNSFDTTDAYKEYISHYKDSRVIAPHLSGPIGTAHNFGQVEPVRIDYIFVNDKITVSEYEADDHGRDTAERERRTRCIYQRPFITQ